MVRLKLREIRTRLGLRQQDVAEKAGLSRGHYVDIENGKRPANTHRLESLARALGVFPHELIEVEAEAGIPSAEIDAVIFSEVADLRSEKQKKMLLSYLRFLRSQEGIEDTPET